MKPKILVITPIQHIDGVRTILEEAGEVTYLPDPSEEQVLEKIAAYDALFTNPNKSKVFISKKIIDAAPSLKIICTASTGTNHIDKVRAKEKGVKIISLTEERETINRITSTAEHAFALMLSALRRVAQGWDAVKKGEWDYEPFVGRQLDQLTVGVVGYGRLGKYFASYAKAFKAKVLAFDPYDKHAEPGIERCGLDYLLQNSDIISFHVHVTPETLSMVNKAWFSKMKADTLLINTSRGDIINELDLMAYLDKNPRAFYATDVLTDETKAKENSVVWQRRNSSKQLLITPHVGGMTREGQMIAYQRAASLLLDFFKKEKNFIS